jgi:diguanylate cyclase (GGDEF)-like protein
VSPSRNPRGEADYARRRPSLRENALAVRSITPALAARAQAYLFAAAGLVGALGVILPHPAQFDGAGMLSVQGASVAAAVVLVALGERVPAWMATVGPFAAASATSLVLVFTGTSTSPYVLFYLWVAFYAFYFLSRLQAAMQVVFIGAAYAVVLALSNEPLRIQSVRWLVFTIALVVAGLLVRVMRERIDTLLSSLDAASRTDMLTGLLDEQGFDAILEKELERARRSGNRVGLALARIDGYDHLRDELGDRRADELLAMVGREIGGTIRLNDEGARIRDEQFAVVCPYTDERGAAIMAERIATLVRERYSEGDKGYTLSFGVASYPKHGAAAEALMHALRQALDEARSLGGDRAVTYFSAENSIEERLRGSGASLEVLTAEPGGVEDGLGVVSRG